MSLSDPDARNRRIGALLQPFAWVLAILGLAFAPVAVGLSTALGEVTTDRFLVEFLLYVLLSVGFGLMLYYTAAHRNALGIAAYIVAYLGGLVLILGSEVDRHTHLPKGIIPALVVYAIAIALIVIYVSHATAAQATMKNGVETTATVTAAGVDGQVNYVTHWRLTLRFTDGDGKDRWFHIGRTGYGYEVGQTFHIKYNPRKPGSRRAIVVLDA